MCMNCFATLYVAIDAASGTRAGPAKAVRNTKRGPGRVAEAANEPAHRRHVVGDPLDVRAVTIWGQDRHRDGVLVDVQTKVGGAWMRNTCTAGSFRMWLRPRSLSRSLMRG